MNSINKKEYQLSNEVQKKQTKTKFGFENLKSNFIFKKIFEYMQKVKILKITRFNKKLQKKLLLNINDYKEYNYQLYYSTIDIELKPDYYLSGKFINISDENKNDFIIYFNNSNEIIRRNNLKENEKVKIIKIKINYRIKSFKDLFCKK